MARLRHRMSCRRGNTRSRPQRAPSSSNSDSSSPSSDYFVGRYPNTRSGRGRSHSASIRMDSPAPATPATLASNMPQTAQFYFNCSMNCPRIIASILVVFEEEPQFSDTNAHSGVKTTATAQDADEKRRQQDMHKEKAYSDEEKDLRRLGHSKKSAASSANKPNEDDNMEAYRCLITEEPPPHHDF